MFFFCLSLFHYGDYFIHTGQKRGGNHLVSTLVVQANLRLRRQSSEVNFGQLLVFNEQKFKILTNILMQTQPMCV